MIGQANSPAAGGFPDTMVRCGSRNSPWLVVSRNWLPGKTDRRRRAGRGRVALMLGEAGIGKTRLAEAAETMARQSGFDVAWGRCSSIEMPSYGHGDRC
jgi:hypothetical protein